MNPFLPLTEYIPDGEPHVFGDRVYLYGSHDKARSDRFCVQDYAVWSAPVDDLSDWKCHGVTYRKDQDPRSNPGKLVDYYAPDCVQGNDGRYYLYYCAMGPNTKNFGPMSVAVSDDPAGPFEYLGDIRYSDGTPVLKYLTNDPAVLNDNGRIWLYYGWGLARDFRSKIFAPIYNIVQSKLFSRSIEEIKAAKPSILSCAVAELEEDILDTSDHNGEQAAIAESKLGQNHVFFLPYLMGERSPINDTNARSTFIGMTMDTTRADMVQAVLEGVAFAIRDSVEVARSLGITINTSKICGGGAKSALWKRIFANVLNCELEIPVSEQGPGMGGAMLAMVACGEYETVKDCCENLCSIASTVKPEPELVAKYEGRYQQFKKIYPACKELFADLI